MTDDTTQPSLEGRRILVVEDGSLAAETLRMLLEDEGVQVVGPVSNVAAGSVAAADEDIDCALLDVNLDGDPVFPIAELLASRSIPFIFSTGYVRSQLPAAYAERPILEKPYDLEELRAALLKAMKT